MAGLINYWQTLSAISQSAFAVLAALILYWFFRIVILSKIERAVEATSNDLDDRMVQFVKQFLWIVAILSTVAFVLKINSIKISPLLAGAGIFGVSIGFAAKETIADILAGIFLITDRPIRVNDRVKIEQIGRHWGGWGDVEDIGLRRTRIRNTDGVSVNYPNSLLANSVITNFSYSDSPVRVRIRLQVDYSADLELSQKLIIEAIESCDKIIPGSAQVVVRSLWDDRGGHQLAGVLLEGRYHINNVRRRTSIRSTVLTEVLKIFQKNNIPLAIPGVRIESGVK
ncbi:MAG TPA: mechanosensitive ion channel family protein [Desulfocapsa sulfexigens]|nr:mechanosensitive ion channel family protein [Desulfocapsa sulfexigens]HIQ37564.1 mechanosensitive ion channel family protein [Desulfocapsa sulfexigens]